MYKERKNYFDKLGTLIRVNSTVASSAGAFSQSYDGDFVSNLPCDRYLDFSQKPDSGKVYDVREYGAVPNDMSRLAHGSINGVIDICSKNGGGTILVSGGDFHCQTIILKSNVTLFVAKGASLVASLDSTGYRYETLLYCENASNVVVTGGGKICGNGNCFNLAPERQPLTFPAPIIDIVEMDLERRSTLRLPHQSRYGTMAFFSNCYNVHIHNFIFENSPYWTIKMAQCKDVEINNIVVNNNRHISNTDGIVLMQSSNINIDRNFISTGGCGICLKNAVWQDCYDSMRNIHIDNCEIQSKSSALKIGDETTNDISDVVVENCKFGMTDVFPGTMSGVSIVSCDGADVKNIFVKNIEMDRVVCPVFIRLCNRNRAYDIDENERSIELNARIMKRLNPKEENIFDWKSQLRNIFVENITATNAEMPVVIAGTFDVKKGIKYIQNVSLNCVDISYRKCKEVYDKRTFIPEYPRGCIESWDYKNLPAYGIWARHVVGLEVKDFVCSPAKATWKDRVVFDNVKKSMF